MEFEVIGVEEFFRAGRLSAGQASFPNVIHRLQQLPNGKVAIADLKKSPSTKSGRIRTLMELCSNQPAYAAGLNSWQF